MAKKERIWLHQASSEGSEGTKEESTVDVENQAFSGFKSGQRMLLSCLTKIFYQVLLQTVLVGHMHSARSICLQTAFTI